MSTAIVSPFIPVDDVAAELGLSLNSVYQLVRTGKLVAHRFGGRNGAIRVHRKNLDAYIEASLVEVSPATAKKRGQKR